MPMSDEKRALLRKILDRRAAELVSMTAACKKLTPMKRAKLQPKVYQLAATIEVAFEIYHADADDGEERIKGLFLTVPLSEYAPSLESSK